jgi:hypothetical protein
MEMACVMARYQFDATLVFMTVAAEEQGLLGAAHWAEQAKQKNLNIAGMFTNDIIGSSRDEHGKIDNKQVRLFAEGLPVQKENSDVVRTLIQTGGENDSLSRQLARSVKESGERYVSGFKVNVIQRRDRYLRGGDHMPFLERGYAALRFTEPAEDFNHQHQNIRTENGVLIGDLPQYNDYAYIAQVARVNAAALATLSLARPHRPGAGTHVQAAERYGTGMASQCRAGSGRLPRGLARNGCGRLAGQPLRRQSHGSHADAVEGQLLLRRAGRGQRRQRQPSHLSRAAALT